MKEKKPFNRKPFVIIIVVCILLFILFACATSEDKKEDNKNVKSTETAEETKAQETEVQSTQSTEQAAVEESEKESEQETVIEHRTGEEIIGISDKDITDIDGTFYDTVRDDVTGNWKCLVIADRIDINEYALSAWKKFGSDGTVLIIENLLTKTSTCITDFSMALDITTYEYTDGEEHSASKMLSGMKLDHVWVYPDNGDIEKITEE